MRRLFTAVAMAVALGCGSLPAWAQSVWSGGGMQGIQPPWNNHSRLQRLGSHPGAPVPSQAPSAEADVSPFGLARSLLWPFGAPRTVSPFPNRTPAQPWPAHPAPGGALPGAVQMPAQVPPTAYHMPTNVYHQWTPQQAQTALHQRTYPGGGGPGVVPAQATQPFPQAGHPNVNRNAQSPAPSPRAGGSPLPGRSIQPQVIGTVDRRELNKPAWLRRLQSLWPFGRR